MIEHRGRFYNAQVLLDELYASLADRTTTRLLAQMSRMRPLVIDELAIRCLAGTGQRLLPADGPALQPRLDNHHYKPRSARLV